jgi:two-component system cell cycle sensor histidine kinase/response regulator CckA
MVKNNMQKSTRSKYKDRKQAIGPLSTYKLIAIFVPIIVIIILGGYFFYASQERHWQQQIQDQLTSIAELKTSQITLWRTERLSDAEYLMDSTLYIEGITEWLESKDVELEQIIRSRLQAIEKHYPYQDILLVDPKGKMLINTNNIVTEMESAALLSLPLAFEGNKAVFVDFHNIGNGHSPHLDVIAPLYTMKDHAREPLAAVILCMDPEYILYPLIESWPTASDTAETLIVRSEGDQVLFLNDLRHQSDTALKLRIPVDQKDVPAIAAISGYEGFFEGRDYRGVKVISVIKRIPDSPWYMIAKEDKEEAFAEMQLNSLLILGTTGGLILIIVGIGLLLWQRRQKQSLETLYNSEIERKALMRHFEYLVKYANDMILLADNNLNIVDANERALETYGYTREEFYKLSVEDLIPPEDLDSYQKRRAEITKQGSIRSEAIHRKKDGSVFPVEVSIKPVIVEDVHYEQAIIRDITDRKKAQEALSHSEAFLKTIIDSSPYSLCIADNKGMMIHLNQACRNLFDASKEELIGKYNIFNDNIIEEQGYMPLVKDVFTKGDTVRFTVKYEFSRLNNLSLQNGREVVLDTTISAVRNNDGTVANAIIQHADITDRSIMEEQLKAVNRLYALLSNINQTIVRTRDLNQLFQAICEIAVNEGRFRMAWIGLIDDNTNDIKPLVHYGNEDGYLQEFYRIRKEHPEYTCPTDRALSEGRAVAFNNLETDIELPAWRDELLKHNYRSLAAVPLKLKGNVIGNLTIYADTKGFFSEMEINLLNEIGTDISFAIDSIKAENDRIIMEKELRLSEQKLASIFNTAPAGIGITVGQVITEVNDSLCEMVGYTRDELINREASILYASKHDYDFARKEMNKHIDARNLYTGELRWQHKNGKMIDVLINAARLDPSESVSSVVFTALNITEKKLQEDERQRIGKLESIGLLAGGIAHDFNNILTAILGNVNLARMKTEPGDEINTLLMESEKASIRAQSLTQQLLTFAKGGAPIKKISSVSEIIREAANFVLRGSNVKCQFSIPDDLWKADIDSGQITQVVSNLVINAHQSLPDGGIIEIACENITLNEMQDFFKKLPLKEGNYIKITIIDHGIGIPPEHLNRIFDPYFTTKQKGSGLGLTIVYSIIRNHGGHIGVESKVGSGSTFYIYLPASSAKTSTRETAKKQLPLEKGRILVMDDEEVVRNVASHMLSYLGFDDVTFAADGAETVKFYKEAMQAGKPFSVIILDLTVPGGMGGKETMKELLQIDPSVRAIVSSGYTNEQVITEFRQHGFSGIVTKPYTIEQLSNVLNEVLSKKPKGQS